MTYHEMALENIRAKTMFCWEVLQAYNAGTAWIIDFNDALNEPAFVEIVAEALKRALEPIRKGE